jgi:MFS family permease
MSVPLWRTRRRSRLQRRLWPLQLAAFLQGFMLWPPVEKLFMTEIGFDAAAVGVMAAAYAAVIPIVEVPSGILADRWSRRGVLVVASAALTTCALVGSMATSVAGYIASALFLGVYFAMYSGTMDAVVYDTVLEESGDSAAFEQRIGRVRLVESVALVGSSLLGGWIAGLTSTRLTYVLTVPTAVASVAALLRFREPQLHRTAEPTPLRQHLAITYRALTRRGRLLPIITSGVLSALVLQLLFEFGPLWLVGLAVPAVLYGPYWAALVSTIGVGGALAGRLMMDRPAGAAAAAALMVLCGVITATSTSIVPVTLAQVVLALLVVIAGIHVSRLLHDAVPSTIRTGVASGVGALSWIVFLPVALAFGLVSSGHGVHTAGWLLTLVSGMAGALLFGLSLRRSDPPPKPRPVPEPADPPCAN